MTASADDALSVRGAIRPQAATHDDPAVGAVWLTAGPVREPIEALLLEMLAPSQPNPDLRESLIEELGRPAKRMDVALEYLGLHWVGRDTRGACPLELVAAQPGRDAWREALVVPGGDCPLGLILVTSDQGRVVVVHEVFSHFGEAQQELVRRLAAMALRGEPHLRILEELRRDGSEATATLAAARRQVQILDPSVLSSADGDIRVQLGSLSQTTRNLLREGIQGEHVFILPANLFEGRTNYGDIEFLVYLNFFARERFRTRIVGTTRQRETLWRLLTLTVFGLFDPALPEQPGFEALQRHYGVQDRETYDFFRMAYETFGVRAGPAPGSPLLRIDDYVDYTVLTGSETRVQIGSKPDSGEVRVRPRGGGFEVRIVSADGQVRAKTLELSVPHRIGVRVPDQARELIQFATDRPRFGVSPLGTSHGFDPAGDLTSLIIWVNGKGILVDPSPEAVAYLERLGVAPVDVPYVFLTHVHADHDGGLIEKLLGGRRTTVIASEVVFRAFAEKTRLITGHDFEGEGFVKHVAAEPGHPVTLELAGETATFETRWNLHPIPTNGFRVSVGGRTFGYSADTKYDPAWLTALRDRGALTAPQYDHLVSFFWTPEGTPTVDLLYHEAGVPPIHTERTQLEALPDPVKARTRLVHVADRDVPAGAVPGKPCLFETHVLLPPTPESRARILLETLRLVGYLYDTPLSMLEALLRGAEVLDWKRDDVIIRKGAVDRAQPLHFFVIADGEVGVRDGRRLLARLVKADSFGEWGISHQRGFRVADVVATRPCRCLRFTEAQYWWLIERQPVVQERISRIRSLLPRLEVAQQRARLQGDRTLSEGRRLLAPLTANQLAGFALFSELQTFRQGAPILTEGGPADGFYVLLSGHLQATVAGRPVGELSEGDGFGEMGLLTGGTRAATITVVSADADVLFMSARSFRAMLEAVPAFAWDVWATAASRRGGSPSGDRREEPV